MIAVEHVPAPAGAPAGASYFKCARLSAVMTTTSCAQRWSAATSESTCSGCAIGRHHQAGGSSGKAPPPTQQERLRECMRCGRTDLRVIQQHALCVSCFNRTAEWRAGRNSKGKAPAHFAPLNFFTVATETPAGDVVHHAIEARHAAEAVGVVASQRLPEGTHLSAARPGDTQWSAQQGRLVIACRACGHAGLLERTWRGALRHHCPACQGAASGPGWALAHPRAPVILLPAVVLAVWLNVTGTRPPQGRWISSEFGCSSCRRAALQVQGTAEAGVQVRCPACGDHHC